MQESFGRKFGGDDKFERKKWKSQGQLLEERAVEGLFPHEKTNELSEVNFCPITALAHHKKFQYRPLVARKSTL